MLRLAQHDKVGERAILFLALVALLPSSVSADTAILVALPSEFDALRKEIHMVGQPVTIAERQIYVGYRKGEKIIIAQSGSGQITAAITTEAVLGRFKVDRLISIGPAGNLSEQWSVGDALIASEIVHYEAGSETPTGFYLKERPKLPAAYIAECDKLRQAAKEVADTVVRGQETGAQPASVRQGRIASGDKFIASNVKRHWLRETFKADAVDMMSAAITRTCEANGVPCVIIRVLSDNADEHASEDFATFTRSNEQPATAVIALKFVDQLTAPTH